MYSKPAFATREKPAMGFFSWISLFLTCQLKNRPHNLNEKSAAPYAGEPIFSWYAKNRGVVISIFY